MRVDILTFSCVFNYGAVLQAYALSERLCELGFEAEVVDFAPPYLAWPYTALSVVPTRRGLRPKRLLRSLRIAAGNLGKLDYFRERRACMDAFQARWFPPRREGRLYFARQLRKLRGDALILGSDQIWNPDCTGGLQPAFFGRYRGANAKRVIAYAASMGGGSLAGEDARSMRRWLGCVDAVSVREEGALPFLRELGAKDAVCVADPTLLLPASAWSKLAAERRVEEPYIYVYSMKNRELLTARLEELMERTGLRALAHRPLDGRIPADRCVPTPRVAGPDDFLAGMRDARCVITDSFHGTIFSVIFHRPFIAVAQGRRALRLTDLLGELGLSDRVCSSMDAAMDVDAPVDWEAVDARIAKLAERSERFLLDQLRLCEEARG